VTRPLLIAAVALAAYAVLNVVFSLIAAGLWQAGTIAPASLPPAARARQLVWLRALPAAGAALITLMLVIPAFTIFEPVHAAESIGPLLVTLALCAAGQLGIALAQAARLAVTTWSLERSWLRAASAHDVDPPAGVPAFVVESAAPMVALVGVLSPKLIAARAVIDACSEDELTAIVAHERGHLHARDNLKRWLMAAAPDALRWTPLHHAITSAWHDAAEDAADDQASAGDERARVDLAALLLKIARLTTGAAWPTATVSPFVEEDGLERRVRRLLGGGSPQPASRWAVVPLAASAAFLAVALAAVASPSAMKAVFDLAEAIVKFGR
jgi:Zn-dependent protease with chaperone function